MEEGVVEEQVLALPPLEPRLRRVHHRVLGVQAVPVHLVQHREVGELAPRDLQAEVVPVFFAILVILHTCILAILVAAHLYFSRF